MQCKLGLEKSYRKRFMIQCQAKRYYEKIQGIYYNFNNAKEKLQKKILE